MSPLKQVKLYDDTCPYELLILTTLDQLLTMYSELSAMRGYFCFTQLSDHCTEVCNCFTCLLTSDIVQTAQTVSSDYDRLVEFFQDVHHTLSGIQTWESQVASIPQLKTVVVEIFGSVLELFGMFTTYTTMKRFGSFSTFFFFFFLKNISPFKFFVHLVCFAIHKILFATNIPTFHIC